MDLQKAFELQKGFRKRMVEERGIEWTNTQWMLQFLTCMIDEIGEVRDELPWKHWKNPFEPNMDNVKGEITDLWIFLIELTISADMTVEELEERFDAKTAENHARQDGTSSKPGYAISADESRAAEIAQLGLPRHRAADKLYATNDVSITERIANQLSSVNPIHGSIQSGRKK